MAACFTSVPLLRERPDLLPLAVAYMIPLINYGDIISDEHCLALRRHVAGPDGGRILPADVRAGGLHRRGNPSRRNDFSLLLPVISRLRNP